MINSLLEIQNDIRIGADRRLRRGIEIEDVRAYSARERVLAGAAEQEIIAGPADKDVTSAAAVDLVGAIAATVAKVLNVSAETLPGGALLVDLGMDSLMALEIQEAVMLSRAKRSMCATF